jgi:predicted ATP-dependent endonuclease of OLD family
LKIIKIEIKRFRSINNLILAINDLSSIISICGANNIGKTNVLRALNLFFNPDDFNFENDIPYLKQKTRGSAVYPEIKLTFKDTSSLVEIERAFDSDKGVVFNELKGRTAKNPENTNGRSKWNDLTDEQIKTILAKHIFFFIPAINISFPELINKIIDDVYDIEFERTRLSGFKKQLKQLFDEYNNGVIDVLNDLAEEINPLFSNFNENWSVEFKSNAEVKKFQDLISENINFYIKDKAGFNNEGKGSGLQKIGFILLHQKIIEKLVSRKKNVILCIDEPDAFIHRGLQLELKNNLNSIAQKNQVFITTHSPEFINKYDLKNVILLDQEIGEDKEYQRSKQILNQINTILVDTNEDEGYKKIQQYLGIEEQKPDLLEKYNIFVEGDTDKIYIENLCNFFGIKLKNIISCNGVTNYKAQLDFYDNWYSDNQDKKPKILLLFDNDEAGRNEFTDIKSKIDNPKLNYKNLEVALEIIINYKGENPDTKIFQKNSDINFEIEDFIYPELIFQSAMSIISQKKLKKFTLTNLENKLKNKGFENRGILRNMDDLLMEKNPNGIRVLGSFENKSIKAWMAKQCNILANPKIGEIIKSNDIKYPEVRNFLTKIMQT